MSILDVNASNWCWDLTVLRVTTEDSRSPSRATSCCLMFKRFFRRLKLNSWTQSKIILFFVHRSSRALTRHFVSFCEYLYRRWVNQGIDPQPWSLYDLWLCPKYVWCGTLSSGAQRLHEVPILRTCTGCRRNPCGHPITARVGLKVVIMFWWCLVPMKHNQSSPFAVIWIYTQCSSLALAAFPWWAKLFQQPIDICSGTALSFIGQDRVFHNATIVTSLWQEATGACFGACSGQLQRNNT